MPKRPRQHEIDELAQRAFHASLPPAWVVNPFIRDYAKDFFVEVVEKGAVTGDVFIVQLKGKEKPRVRRGDNTLTVRIEREHLRYYLDVLPLPVFIVAVDVGTGEAYFHFAQREIEANPTLSAAFRADGHATFRLPLANTLSDTGLLLREVTSAWAFMREKYPGSIRAAIEHRQRSLTALDPRFTYDLSLIDGKEKIHLSTKGEPVSMKLSVSGDPKVVATRWRKFIGEGEPLQADAFLRLNITGSPIFEKKPPVAISFNAGLLAEARLFVESNGSDRFYFPDFRAPLTGGTELLRLCGRLPSCPLQVELEVRRDGEAKVSLGWKPSVWVGQRVAQLPWLDPLHQFLERLFRPEGRMGVVISSRGTHFGDLTSAPMAQLNSMDGFRALVALLIKVRHIVRALGIEVRVPKDWSDQDLDDVEELYSLTKTGRYTSPHTIDFSCTLDRLPDQIARGLKTDERGTFKFANDSATYSFLDVSFDFSETFQELSKWRRVEVEDVEVEGEPRTELRLFGCTRSTVWPRFLPT